MEFKLKETGAVTGFNLSLKRWIWPHSGERLCSGDPGGRVASEESIGIIQARGDERGDKTESLMKA